MFEDFGLEKVVKKKTAVVVAAAASLLNCDTLAAAVTVIGDGGRLWSAILVGVKERNAK